MVVLLFLFTWKKILAFSIFPSLPLAAEAWTKEGVIGKNKADFDRACTNGFKEATNYLQKKLNK